MRSPVQLCSPSPTIPGGRASSTSPFSPIPTPGSSASFSSEVRRPHPRAVRARLAEGSPGVAELLEDISPLRTSTPTHEAGGDHDDSGGLSDLDGLEILCQGALHYVMSKRPRRGSAPGSGDSGGAGGGGGGM